MRPAIGSTHRIVWHPVNGDVRRSAIQATVVSVSPMFCYVQPEGMGVLQVTWAEWGRMVGNETAS